MESIRKLRTLDLCAGLGGFHQGLIEAFKEDEDSGKQRSFSSDGVTYAGCECVLAAELEKPLRRKYIENFPDISMSYQWHKDQYTTMMEKLTESKEKVPSHLEKIYDGMFEEDSLKMIHGDFSLLVDEKANNDFQKSKSDDPIEITKENEHLTKGTLRTWPHKPEISLIPDHDLLCAGFPCQPFSRAGKQKGFGDPRGTVWNWIRIILQHKKPKFVFLENVGNFASHEQGRTWKRVFNDLKAVGYNYIKATDLLTNKHKSLTKPCFGLLSPHHIGLPAHRERFFIIAVRADNPEKLEKELPYPFPIGALYSKKQTIEELLGKKIETKNWKEEEIVRKQKKKSACKNVENTIHHWQKFLNVLFFHNKLYEGTNRQIEIPSFPIWGYELHPNHFYPTSKKVSKDAFEQVEDKSKEIKQIEEERLEEIKAFLHEIRKLRQESTGSPPKKKEESPQSSVDDLLKDTLGFKYISMTKNEYVSWITGKKVSKFHNVCSRVTGEEVSNLRCVRPNYSFNNSGWDKSKSYDKQKFIKRVRDWAVKLWAYLDKDFDKAFMDVFSSKQSFDYFNHAKKNLSKGTFMFTQKEIDKIEQKDVGFLRWWLQKLYTLPPTHQKLEWNCSSNNDDEFQKHLREHGIQFADYILQTRPSGLRVKDIESIPALIAQSNTQVPIIFSKPANYPEEKEDLKFRHLTLIEGLRLQGFPDFWELPEKKPWKPLGNAVHAKLIKEIFSHWLFGTAKVQKQTFLIQNQPQYVQTELLYIK